MVHEGEGVILRSPAEPPAFADIGTSSPVPESLGMDFIIGSPNGLVGIQRKTTSDAVSSLYDDRLARENLMRDRLHIAILLIEGRPKVTSTGEILGVGYRFTIEQFRGLLWTARAEGWWVDFTENTQDTIRYLHALEKWAAKGRHVSLRTRKKKAGNAWGTRKSTDQQAWALQSVDGLSSELAQRIVDSSTGRALQLTVSREDLLNVDGIGKKRADKIWQVFGRDDE